MSQQIGNELPHIETAGNQVPDMPAIETPESQALTERQGAAMAERPNSTPPPQVQSRPQQVSVPHDDYMVVRQADDTAASLAAGMPQIADDNDLIEKEWVLKAKEIVERTKQDPYLQNKEVERMKADYMQKRYSKDIKLTED